MPNTANAHTGQPASPMRLLLSAGPEEFIDERHFGQTESDREFLVRQARRVVDMNDGRGPTGMTNEEYSRIKNAWLLGKPQPAIDYFAPTTYAEIRRVEQKLADQYR